MQKHQEPLGLKGGALTLPPEYTAVESYVTHGGTKEPDTQRLCPLLLSSGLSRTTLAQLWEVANRRVPGQLSVPELYTLLALVALAQQGKPLTDVGKGLYPVPKLNYPNSSVPPLQRLDHQDPFDDEFDDFKSATQVNDDDFSEFQQALPSLPAISQPSSASIPPSFYKPPSNLNSVPSFYSSANASVNSKQTSFSSCSSSSICSSFSSLSNTLANENKSATPSPLVDTIGPPFVPSSVQQSSLLAGFAEPSSSMSNPAKPASDVLIDTANFDSKFDSFLMELPQASSSPQGIRSVQPSPSAKHSGSSVFKPQQTFTLPSPLQKNEKLFPTLVTGKRLNIGSQVTSSFRGERLSSGFQNPDMVSPSPLSDFSSLSSTLTTPTASAPRSVCNDVLVNVESCSSFKADVPPYQPSSSLDIPSVNVQSAPLNPPRNPSSSNHTSIDNSSHPTVLMPTPAVEDRYSCFRELDRQSDISSWSLSQESSSRDMSTKTKTEDEDEFGDFVGVSNLSKEPLSEVPPLMPSSLVGNSEMHLQNLANDLPQSFSNLNLAPNNDDFADFQSCSSNAIKSPEILKAPILNELTAGNNESFFANSTKNISNVFKQQECRSVSSLELDFPSSEALSDLTTNSDLKKPSPLEGLQRQGSLQSLDFKISFNSPSMERAGSPTSLDFHQPYSPSPFEALHLQGGSSSTQLSPISNESSAAKLSSDDDISSSLQPTQTTQEDRYKFIRLEVEQEESHLPEEPGDQHLREWFKCLTSCQKLLDEACSIFGSVSSPKICKEILSSDKGIKYITNLGEVCKVVERITVALQSSGKQDPTLQSVLHAAQSSWDSLAALVDSSLLPTPPSIPATTLEDDTAVACGVCLLRVEDSLLWYGGRQYHAGCANLWVNCVEPILPSLPIP